MQRYQCRQTVKSISKVNQTNREVSVGSEEGKQSKNVGLKGIVIKNKQHVFLDKNKCIKFANKNKIFISIR